MTYPVSIHHLDPRNGDLEALERIAARRAEVEAVRPDGGERAALRRFLLATLDEMEETLCVRGCRAAAVREGWRRLALFESFGNNGHGGNRDES